MRVYSELGVPLDCRLSMSDMTMSPITRSKRYADDDNGVNSRANVECPLLAYSVEKLADRRVLLDLRGHRTIAEVTIVDPARS